MVIGGEGAVQRENSARMDLRDEQDFISGYRYILKTIKNGQAINPLDDPQLCL